MMKKFILMLAAATAINAATAQDKILWGGPGSKDGEFDGGFNGWTTVGVKSSDASKKDAAKWEWSATPTAAGGYTSAANATLNSVSAANGVAIFNADVLDSGTGTTKNPGTGVAPGPNGGELISPIINLKGTKDVTLVFSQRFRNFRSDRPRTGTAAKASTAIMYSRDGGATWSDPIAIEANELCKTYQYSTDYQSSPVTRVQLPDVGDTDNFRVKFSWDGYFYFWIVDDVAIVAQERNNLRANGNFFATAENILTPITQLRESYFLNDVQNLGTATQTNVRHTMTIYKTTVNAAGQTALVQPALFKDTLSYGSILRDSIKENVSFKKGFKPENLKSNYAGIYELISDSTDVEPANNRRSFVFSVTDSTFAKDNGATRGVAPNIGANPTWGYGNVFYVAKGSNFRSGTVTFGLDNADDYPGQAIDIYLYEWSADADTDGNGDIDEDELTTAGYATYTIKGTEQPPSATVAPIRVKLDNFASANQPIKLKDNTYYIVYVENPVNKTDVPLFLSAYDRYDYAASKLAYEGLGKQSFYSVLKIGDSFFDSGFTSMVPTIRWNIRTIVDAKEPKLAENTVTVGPNPAVDFINVKFDFENIMKNADIIVTDINGREVINAQFSDVQNDIFNLDITNLTAGTYNMFVRTEKGVNTKTFVVQK